MATSWENVLTPHQRQALESFAAHLPRGARVLYAAGKSADSVDEARSPEWFRAQGFQLEILDSEKDLRFLSFKKETQGTLDAIWAGRALLFYSIEEAQRILATFFQALRPKSGILFAVHSYSQDGFASMLRQNGYQIHSEGTRPGAPSTEESQVAVIVRRI